MTTIENSTIGVIAVLLIGMVTGVSYLGNAIGDAV